MRTCTPLHASGGLFALAVRNALGAARVSVTGACVCCTRRPVHAMRAHYRRARAFARKSHVMRAPTSNAATTTLLASAATSLAPAHRCRDCYLRLVMSTGKPCVDLRHRRRSIGSARWLQAVSRRPCSSACSVSNAGIDLTAPCNATVAHLCLRSRSVCEIALSFHVPSQ